MKRGGFLKRRTPLRPKHRASIGDVLTLMHHFGTDPRCAFPDCTMPANDLHHRLPKGRGGTDERTNIVPLCRGPGTNDHHGWVHANPEAANKLGLLDHSWDKLRPRFGPDGSITNLDEFPTPELRPGERSWCACGHSLLVHDRGPCRGIHSTGMDDDRPCRCPMFFYAAGDQSTEDA